jgi:signal transduction histidine kinase
MFATAALLLCVASLLLLRRCVDESVYDELKERAEDVQLLLSHSDPSLDDLHLSGELSAIYDLKDDGKYLQVRDERGNWLFRSKRMVAENLNLPSPASLPKAGQTANFHQGTRFVRVLTYPISAHGKHYSVQTGLALNKSMVLVASFRNSLLLLAPVVILLAAAGGHVMSRKALRPIAELGAQARRINDRNLETRLPVPRAIDEISDLSRTLNLMLERIDRAFASVRTFTGNASHELRTPISLLRTEIEVALYRPREVPEYRAILLRLHVETLRMTNLVENLLSLARADGGADAMSLMPIRVGALFHQIRDVWSTPMHKAMLNFRVDGADDDLLAIGDEAGILRMLSILLENSSQYTPPGGAVSLCAKVEAERVVLSVADTGIGIAPEDLERIFDRFYRAQSEGGYHPEGSGLGLSLAKWIAQRHGTNLEVESAPGKGSRFWFSLERAPGDCSSFDGSHAASEPVHGSSRQHTSQS